MRITRCPFSFGHQPVCGCDQHGTADHDVAMLPKDAPRKNHGLACDDHPKMPPAHFAEQMTTDTSFTGRCCKSATSVGPLIVPPAAKTRGFGANA
jgi:hypothetical protein